MARAWLPLLGAVLLLGGCGGRDICDCEAEARVANPRLEVMQECAKLYEGKDYEQIESELEDCGK